MLRPAPDLDPELAQLLAAWPYGATFDLPEQATVIVAGAYKGRVMRLLDALYDIKRMIGFEPQPWAYDIAASHAEPHWELYPFAIGTETGTFPMGEWETDACSFIDDRREYGDGKMREALQAFSDLSIEHIDLAVFNMEGYEYKLVPHLFGRGDLVTDLRQKPWGGRNIDRLAVQWHRFAEPLVQCTHEMAVAGLEFSHHLVYDHFPQWEVWEWERSS